jgi:type II secretory pathway pseudopilin PulG
MKILKRCHVTLLEILLVLAILSILSGFVAINTFKAVREQRFRSEVAQVVDYLRLAQNIMLIMNTDVLVKFKSSEGALVCTLEFDHSTTKGWAKELKRPPKEFKTLHYIGFKDENFPEKAGEITIHFLSGGSMMSKGEIELSTNDPHKKARDENTLVNYILLRGYPSPIQSTLKESKNQDLDEKFLQENKQLTDNIYREIKELEQSKKTK